MDKQQKIKERRARLTNTGLRIGKHFSPGGKRCNVALATALEAPATAMQIFGAPENSRGYWCNNVEMEDVTKFRAGIKEAKMYTAVHAVFIINPAADPINESRHARLSTHAIVNHMIWANRMGCDSVVLHAGSAKDAPKEDGINWAIQSLREAMINYDDKLQELNGVNEGGVQLEPNAVRLLLENCAGDQRNRKLGGADLTELPRIVNEVGDPRIGIVIDTTHAYAAGHSVPEIIEALQDPLIGRHLDLVHFNTPEPYVKKGSFLDRHSSQFVDGAFTLDECARIFHAFRELPLILEGTPHLATDLVWMLRWELELRDKGFIERVPPHVGPPADDIFTLYQEIDA